MDSNLANILQRAPDAASVSGRCSASRDDGIATPSWAGNDELTRARRWSWLATMIAAATLIAPIWIVELPAMPDLPAHLASFYLLAGGVKNPFLAHFYRLDWQFVPNLAAEIVVPFLSYVTGLVPAAKIYLTLSVAFWVFGAAFLERALFRRVGIAPVFAAFFVYNANFFWGFLNYDFAAGLSLVLFAAWIASRDRVPALRLAGFAVGMTVVYFCHVFAAAALLLMMGCYAFEMQLREKKLFGRASLVRLAELMVVAAPSVIAFLVLRPHAADGGHLEFNFLSSWDDRLGAAFQNHFDDPGYVTLAVLALFWIVGMWRGWFVLHASMRTTVIVLAACVVLMPEWAMGGWGVDLRMPALLGVVAFAAVECRLPLRKQAALAVAGLAWLGVCAAAVAGNWLYYDRQYDEFRAAIAESPEGTRFLTALDGDAMGLASDQPYWHMAEFAIIDRHGFTPLLFTTAGQHVVRVQPAYQSIAAATAQQGSPPDIGELDDLAAGQIDGDADIRDVFPYLMRYQCHFDEVVVITSGGRASPPAENLRLRKHGSFFDLYDVRRDESCDGE